jgi:hypothetical protein
MRKSAIHEAARKAAAFNVRQCSDLIEATPIGTEMELRAFKLVQLEYKFLERMYMHVVEVSRKTIDTSDVIDLSKSSHFGETFRER